MLPGAAQPHAPGHGTWRPPCSLHRALAPLHIQRSWPPMLWTLTVRCMLAPALHGLASPLHDGWVLHGGAIRSCSPEMRSSHPACLACAASL
jgi:hypothetical protein